MTRDNANTMPRSVVTVLGLRPEQPGGIVDAHGHVWVSPPQGVQAQDAPFLADEDAISAELRAFRAADGIAVVDCQPGGAGRDIRQLVRLSRKTGVDLVASTGFHLQRYYPPVAWVWSAPVDAVADFFIKELTQGMWDRIGAPTAARAGIIKTAYTGSLENADSVRLLTAACAASQQSGAALMVHTEQGHGVDLLAAFFDRNGVSASRVVLSHVDKRPDVGLHRELAAAGFLLEFDTFLRPKYEPQVRLWPLLERLLELGYASSLACGLDLANAAMWRFGSGGPGMLGLAEVVRVGLQRLGASQAQTEALMGGNIYARIARPVGDTGFQPADVEKQ